MNRSKLNQSFLGAYIKLDKVCADKLDAKYGVTEYIDKLTDARLAPERDDVLKRLIKYRKIRNKLAHEPDAMEKLDEASRDDVKWLEKFERRASCGKDPLSKYLKRAGSSDKRRALVRTLALAGAALVAILVIILIFKVF